MPFVTVGEEMFSDLDVYNLKEGDTLTLDHDVRLHMDTVTEGKDEEWFYFFTGEEESRRKQCGNVIISIPLYAANCIYCVFAIHNLPICTEFTAGERMCKATLII